MNNRFSESFVWPKSFVWGVATSSYQIEGAPQEDGKGPSIWDTFSHTPGKVQDGSTGDVACDHYHRWQDDLDLIQGLNVGAYRFSISWPRILPEGTGQVNEAGLEFYERLVNGILERGLQPFCTLYHWDLPQALQDKGGWANRDTVQAFVEYADVVTKRLGDKVAAYTTFNEPWVSAHLGHAAGEHAPGIKDFKTSLQVAHHLLLSHGTALPIMRENAPEAAQGIVLNLSPTYAASSSDEDATAARRLDGMLNRWYLDPVFKGHYPEDIWNGFAEDVPEVMDGDLEAIAAPVDYLGVNYYTRAIVAHEDSSDFPHLKDVSNPDAEHTEMDWEVFSQGLSDLLTRLQQDYGAPLYITENGAAFADEVSAGEVDDEARVRYLQTHIQAVQNAIEGGADVRGYFAWSLMDNFEWAFGYTKRFGIVYVDFETQERILKASGKWYQAFIKHTEPQLAK